jgi:hypothetical protein
MKPLLEQAPDVRTATASLPVTAAASVQIVDPLAVAEWDALVMSLPGHSFFHSSAWARVLVETYGYVPKYFTAWVDGQLTGVIPLMEVNSWLTGKRAVGLPFSDECEPIGEGIDLLLKAATNEGARRGWKSWEVRGSIGEPVQSQGTYYSHTLALGCPDAALLKSFDSAVRGAIKKAEKANLTVTIGHDIADMRVFYDLNCKTRKKHGVPPQPFSFFQNLHQHIIAKRQGFITLARTGDTPIASNIFVHAGRRAVYKYSASDEEFRALCGPNLVLWRAIQWCNQAGIQDVDFGRTLIDNVGLRRFKRHWNTEERTLSYFKYNLRAKQFVTGKGESSQSREKIVRHIPIPIARMIGSVLYRHVA